MNSRVRQIIRKLVQEASNTEHNEYYIDLDIINESDIKKESKPALLKNKKPSVKS